MSRIRCNSKVRELLVELDSAILKLGEQTRVLASRDTDPRDAINVGYDKQHQERVILGIAWRINKASKGIE